MIMSKLFPYFQQEDIFSLEHTLASNEKSPAESRKINSNTEVLGFEEDKSAQW